MCASLCPYTIWWKHVSISTSIFGCTGSRGYPYTDRNAYLYAFTFTALRYSIRGMIGFDVVVVVVVFVVFTSFSHHCSMANKMLQCQNSEQSAVYEPAEWFIRLQRRFYLKHNNRYMKWTVTNIEKIAMAKTKKVETTVDGLIVWLGRSKGSLHKPFANNRASASLQYNNNNKKQPCRKHRTHQWKVNGTPKKKKQRRRIKERKSWHDEKWNYVFLLSFCCIGMTAIWILQYSTENQHSNLTNLCSKCVWIFVARRLKLDNRPD